ncbi:cAMP phosphodiesterase [Prochlorococcus sp. MIT 1223]|uniref:cAMP phosphodiesterase n=1 Tax=Prochlorococcus sp. MIT 1223 TaxID=3096217 RepID=UPI002A764246|nr:cAMP phosphodiesterase [Prochlorococcus sp. MIT 1223]
MLLLEPLRKTFIPSFKAFLIALTIVPITFLGLTISGTARERSSKNKNDVEIQVNPATQEDTFLYRQISINYFCRARMAEIEFPKALGISSATFADVIDQKHGGLVSEIPDSKLTPKQLYMSAEIQIVEGAIKFCPKQVPDKSKKQFKEFIKKQKKSKK